MASKSPWALQETGWSIFRGAWPHRSSDDEAINTAFEMDIHPDLYQHQTILGATMPVYLPSIIRHCPASHRLSAMALIAGWPERRLDIHLDICFEFSRSPDGPVWEMFIARVSSFCFPLLALCSQAAFQACVYLQAGDGLRPPSQITPLHLSMRLLLSGHVEPLGLRQA